MPVDNLFKLSQGCVDQELAIQLRLAAAQKDSATASEAAVACRKELVDATKAARQASLEWDLDYTLGIVLVVLQALSMLRGLIVSVCISRGWSIPKWIFLPEW